MSFDDQPSDWMTVDRNDDDDGDDNGDENESSTATMRTLLHRIVKDYWHISVDERDTKQLMGHR
jgi:hypothetical protein